MGKKEMKRIKILKIELDKAPYEKEIDNKLEPLQEEVEGLIDCVYLEEGCVAVINDEGKLNGMQPNRRFGSDIICGPFFMCGDSPDGEFVSLPEKLSQKYQKLFAEIEQFTGQKQELEPKMIFIAW